MPGASVSCLRSLGVEMTGITKFLNMSSQKAGQAAQFVNYLNVGSGGGSLEGRHRGKSE